jgi:hypothetical protein
MKEFFKDQDFFGSFPDALESAAGFRGIDVHPAIAKKRQQLNPAFDMRIYRIS